MARILINNSPNNFYTLEVRQPSGNPLNYDKWLPGFAVIIHEVETSRTEPAIVIDQDGDCITGDAGAMFTPGEVFTDIPNGVTVSIDSATETGYVVTIRNRYNHMTDVEISGDQTGYLEERILFTATVSPNDSITPITYRWEATGQTPVEHTSDIMDQIYYTWDEFGTKAITVTATNLFGSVVDTHYIDIVQKVPIVSLSGPVIGSVGAMNVFTATVFPVDVIQPITYTWQASGQLPITHESGISDVVSYVWDDPGTQVITVTAKNLIGSTVDIFSLPVYVPPASLELTGPEVGDVKGNYTITATVNPITTTVPMTYVWTVNNEILIVNTSGVFDTATFHWEKPGVRLISVSASNLVGSVVDTWSITIYIRVYLPINMRN